MKVWEQRRLMTHCARNHPLRGENLYLWKDGRRRCRACRDLASKSHEKRRPRYLRKYGLTPESYDALLVEQGGRCAICQALPTARALAVDHDHETGAVRGLLCTSCNVRLAALDDRGWQSRAEVYLGRTEPIT